MPRSKPKPLVSAMTPTLDPTTLRAYATAILTAKDAVANRDDLAPEITGKARITPAGRVIITVIANLHRLDRDRNIIGGSSRQFTFALRPDEVADNLGHNRAARMVRDWIIPTVKGL